MNLAHVGTAEHRSTTAIKNASWKALNAVTKYHASIFRPGDVDFLNIFMKLRYTTVKNDNMHFSALSQTDSDSLR